ncbi:MarR family winged helix-turn-helix transcriptional regulator [Leifsonia kafniensis]|uniref:MarR family winged helix-turn-helix transcriptional regulator n=1 Tax=Leifsonia kafniensis TaxID=475957 RepID=UPI0031E71B4E
MTDSIPTPAEAEMHNRPGHLIRRAQQVHSYLWTSMVSKDVTPSQFSALTVVAANPLCDQITLSRESGLDTSTAGTVIHRLVGAGWVEIDRDPKDRRRKLLSLTIEGQRVFDETLVKASAMTERMVECLDGGEQRQLTSLLARIVTHGEKLRESHAEGATAAGSPGGGSSVR